MSDKIIFEIVKNLGCIRQPNEKGWKKEINIINWNNKGNKIDIREWSDDHKKMSKGITFSKKEFINLKDIINNTEFDDKLLI